MKFRFVSAKNPQKKSLFRLFSLKSLGQGPLPDMGLLFCVLGLLIFGWVMVYSSSALYAETKYHDQFYFLKRQVVWSLLGLLAFAAATNIPIEFWQKYSKVFYVLIMALLVLVLVKGPEISGARRWLRVGGLGIQPSELAKLGLILIVADYLDRRQSRLRDFKRGLLPLLTLVGAMLALIAAEPDLGTPVLMVGVIFSMMLLGGSRWRHFFIMALVSLPLIILAIVKVRYRMARMFAYLDPFANAKGTGYQLAQSLLALGSGGIFGRGLGASRFKISNLPDCHTDFVFSVLGEELGLVGTLACAGFFLFLCMRGLRIGKNAPTCFARLVAIGLSLTIGLQALINMGVACGLFPTKGMPLPFLSFGGSSLVITLFSVGLLAGLSRQMKIGTKNSG